MDNDFGTQDIITGRGLGVGGFEYGANGSFASPSANAVRIDANKDIVSSGIENLLDQNQFAATNKNIVDGHAQICDRVTNSEFRNSDRLRDLEREMNANARETAKCCCDAKLEACKNTALLQTEIVAQNAQTRDLINQNTIRAAVDQNNVSATVGAINAAAAANTAAIVAAINCSSCCK